MVVEYKHCKLNIWGECRPSPSSLPAKEKKESRQVEGQRLRDASEKVVMESAPEASAGVLEASPDLMPCVLR